MPNFFPSDVQRRIARRTLIAGSLSSHLEAEIRRALADGDATGVIWWGKMRLTPRAELLRVLMLPDSDRADAIGSYWESQDSHLRELLIDCEEYRTLRAVLVGMLRELRPSGAAPRSTHSDV